MDNADVRTPDLLTTDELRELDDLESWITELFDYAGLRHRLSNAKRYAIIDSVLGEAYRLFDTSDGVA